ncbi:CAP domain-containing protein [Massilia eurypsychrophila]|nr:CAP domain-containing protein [Massilia eurypsychrophila]
MSPLTTSKLCQAATLAGLGAVAAMLASSAVHAQQRDPLVALINSYRSAPGSCEGRRASPVPPLAPQPALSRVKVTAGAFLDQVLARAGYPVARAEAITIAGAADARDAMAIIEQRYCRTLLRDDFSAIGASRNGDSWLIVLAQPAPPSPILLLGDTRDVGKAILREVNEARAAGQTCGDAQFAAVAALAWNSALGDAALSHSLDMASQHFFQHKGKDGRLVGERASAAGYRWRRVGENIAAGQESAEDAVAGWLSSPGHCANIMNPAFTEMGAAYAVDTSRDTPRVYWTQVFGAPR